MVETIEKAKKNEQGNEAEKEVAEKVKKNDRLDVYKVEQRLKYLGYGVSAVKDSKEITVNGSFDDAEKIVVRQFDQIGKNDPEYKSTEIKKEPAPTKDDPKATKDKVVDLPPITLKDAGIGWFNAYNAPHWMQYSDELSKKLRGWVDKTGGGVKSMGTSWVFDLMLATQKSNEKRDKLWFAGAGNLGTRLNLGINEKYIGKNTQKSIYGDEFLLGLSRVDSVDLGGVTGNANYPLVAANKNGNEKERLKYLLEERYRIEQTGTGSWDADKAKKLADLLQYINRTAPTGKENANNQTEALKDFLAVYTATQNDSADNKNGSLEEQLDLIKSGTGDDAKKKEEANKQIQKLLFGDGTQDGGVIDKNGLLLGSKSDKGGIGASLDDRILRQIMNKPNSNMAEWASTLNAVLAGSDINTPTLLAIFLGNVAQETDNLDTLMESYRVKGTYVDETQSYNTYEKNYTTISHPDNDLGNINVGDGSKFRGRGLLHITGRNNYGLLSFGKIYNADGSALESVKTDFNDWMGTKTVSTATSVAVPNANTVTVTGTTQPNWWVRVEFPKAGGLAVERKDVQADATGNYTVSSGKAHPAGTVNVTAVRYNFTEDAQQISNSESLSAQVGAWYWRFAKNKDLNKDPSEARARAKINGGEDPSSDQGVSRNKHVKLAKDVIRFGNTYSNMRQLLGNMSIKASNSADYNTKFGITLKKRDAIKIDKGTSNLLVADESMALDDLDVQTLSQDLQTNFDFNAGEVDMLYMNMPDSAPVQIPIPPTIVASAAVVRPMRTDGVCHIVSANSPEYPDEHAAEGMGYAFRMRDFLPKDFVNHLGKGVSADELRRYSDWADSLVVKITRPPQHGKMSIVPSVDSMPSYIPNKSFLGKDRVEVEIRGKDFNGQAIVKKVIYFINVVPKEKMDGIIAEYTSALQKFCGTSKPVWWISESNKGSSYLATWQQNAELGSLIASASNAIPISKYN